MQHITVNDTICTHTLHAIKHNNYLLTVKLNNIDTLIKEDDVGMAVYDDDDDKAIAREDWLDYLKICKYHCFSFVHNINLTK